MAADLTADLKSDLHLIFERVVKEKRTLPALHQQSPQRAPGRAAPPASPHNKICTFCREQREQRMYEAFDYILRLEALQRQHIADDQSRDRESFEQQFVRNNKRSAKATGKQGNATAEDDKVSGADVLLIAERHNRRLINETQVAEFDEAAAAFRLTIRQAVQKHEVAERSKKRAAQESSDRKMKDAQAASAKQDFNASRQRQLVEDDETRCRQLLVEMEATVSHKMSEVAFVTRRDIRQHEARVEAMMQKHYQRLELLEAEIARVIFEENAARERHCAAERKAFETTVCMEPDLKKRATAHTKQRQIREAREISSLVDEEAARRTDNVAAEEAAYSNLRQASTDDARNSVHREKRRNLREARRAMRLKAEEKALSAMEAHENAVWSDLRSLVMREAFANPVPIDELGGRSALEAEARTSASRARAAELERDLMLVACRRGASEMQLELTGIIAAASSSTSPQLGCFYAEHVARCALEELAETQLTLLLRCFSEICAVDRVAKRYTAMENSQGTATAPVLTALDAMRFTACLNGSRIDVGARIKATWGNARPTEHTIVRVRVINAEPDDLLSCGMAMERAKIGVLTEVNSAAALPFAGVMLQCRSLTASPSMFNVRIVEYVMTGHEPFYGFVNVTRPAITPECDRPSWLTLCGSQSSSATSRCDGLLRPLSALSLPAFSKPINSVSVGVYLKTCVAGQKAIVRAVAPFKMDGSHGITCGTAVLCKHPAITEYSVELSCAGQHAASLLQFAATSICLNCGDADAAETACTVRVEIGTVDAQNHIFEDEVRWDAIVSSPSLPLPSTLSVRCPCRPSESAEKLSKLAGEPTFFLPPTARLVFPMCHTASLGEGRIVGGTVELEIESATIGTLDVVTTPELTAAGWLLEGTKISWRDDSLQQYTEVCAITGRRTSALRFKFKGRPRYLCCPTPSAVRELLRHVVMFPAPFAGSLPVTSTIVTRCDIGTAASPGGPAESRGVIKVLPPLLVPFSGPKGVEGPLNLAYVEGAPPKPLPAFAEITAPADGFGIGARLRVEIVSGLDAGDEISLVEGVPGSDGTSLFKVKGAVAAWWWSANTSLLDMRFTGDAMFTPTRVGETGPQSLADSASATSLADVAVTAPYTGAGLAEVSTVTAPMVMLALRAIRFRSPADAKNLKKQIKVTFDDGRYGRSCALIDVKIENVDDPTEILFASTTVPFTPFQSSFGVPLMRNVRLQDPDSDNFHDGFISVDLAAPGVGDQLLLLGPDGQAAAVFDGSVPAPAVARVLRSHHDEDAVSEAEPTRLHALPLLLELFVSPVLKCHGDRLFFKGESIGTITSKTAAPATSPTAAAAPPPAADAESPKTSFRIDFFAESRFVPFAVAEHILRSFAFDNKMLKPKQGPRKIEIKLTAGTALTTETITVVVGQPVLSPVPITAGATTTATLTVIVDDPAKPKQIIPQAVANVQGDVLHTGFFHARIVNPHDKAEELLFDGGVVKQKEKTVSIGKDSVGVLQHPRVAPSDLYVIFSKVNADYVASLAKALCFKGPANLPGSTRKVVVRCGVSSDDTNASTFEVDVVVPNKSPAPELSSVARRVYPLQQSGETVFRVVEGVAVKPSHAGTFASGTQISVRVGDSSPSTEMLVLSAVGSVSPKCSTRAAPVIDIFVGDVRVAKTATTVYEYHGHFVAGRRVSFTLVAEATAEMVSQLLSVVGYLVMTATIRGAVSRKVDVSLRDRTAPTDAATAPLESEGTLAVTFDILPRLLAVGDKPISIDAGALDPTAVVSACKVWLSAAETDSVEVLASLEGGEASDALAVELTSRADFTLDGTVVKSAQFTLKDHARGKPRKVPIGSLILPERKAGDEPARSVIAGTSIHVRFAPVTATAESMVTAWLESLSVCASRAPVGGRNMTIRIAVITKYVTHSVVVPVEVKPLQSSVATSRVIGMGSR